MAGYLEHRASETVIAQKSPDIHSCRFCSVQEIDIGMRLQNTARFLDGTIVKYRGSNVLDGASNGCALFQRMEISLKNLIDTYSGKAENPPITKINLDNWICELRIPEWMGAWEWASMVWVHAPGELPGVIVDDGDIAEPEQTSENYCILAYPGDPAAQHTLTRPFSYDFQTVGSRLWAKDCLRTCQASHLMCSFTAPSFLPTRLLSLERTGDASELLVRLITTAASAYSNPEVAKYAALTYCWGGVQPLKLEAGSEELLICGIRVSSFPKTIHDAMQVALDMGVSLIWIDCLCIRQDDPMEVALEISMVPVIYGNSYITISADRASHCRQGFLQPVSLPSTSTTNFRVPFACHNGKRGSVILSNGPAFGAPIDDRAWTMQEYLLSRRILRFTDFGLYWSCRETHWQSVPDSGNDSRYMERLKQHSNLLSMLQNTNMNCKGWMKIVEEYTKRKMTYNTDKLPAISGIAECLAQQTKDFYVAGLWKSHLPLGLLWASAQPHLQSNSQEYRAPSWSWASLEGQVDWFDHLQTKVDRHLSILACDVMPTFTQAPYGTVTSGSLVLSGHLQGAAMCDIDKSFPPSSPGLGDIFLDLALAHIDLDFCDNTLISKVAGSQLFCLQVCCFDEATLNGPSGLLLVTEDGRTFSRIGIFGFRSPETDNILDLGQDIAIHEYSNKILRV
ncbi:hypothetical protein HD806DRAFT_506649 [Xylariaceae sp. AK1471]|nr:hypothetical protein HD806DRAFT_506649 [Xylariaceae sp. AK1471]